MPKQYDLYDMKHTLMLLTEAPRKGTQLHSNNIHKLSYTPHQMLLW
jgi:hypothetical protein